MGEKIVRGGKAGVTVCALWLLNCPDHDHNLQVAHLDGERLLRADAEAVLCLRANGVGV